jgi:hypothetical protein
MAKKAKKAKSLKTEVSTPLRQGFSFQDAPGRVLMTWADRPDVPPAASRVAGPRRANNQRLEKPSDDLQPICKI